MVARLSSNRHVGVVLAFTSKHLRNDSIFHERLPVDAKDSLGTYLSTVAFAYGMRDQSSVHINFGSMVTK